MASYKPDVEAAATIAPSDDRANDKSILSLYRDLVTLLAVAVAVEMPKFGWTMRR